jgi:hypothetical protein
MRSFSILSLCVLACVAAGPHAPALAGALEDVSIVEDRDDRDATVYKLVNRGEHTVRATVELSVVCSGTPTDRGPISREYHVGAGQSIELGKTRPESNCERSYAIVGAEYA